MLSRVFGGFLSLVDFKKARHYPAAATAAVITINAVAENRHTIEKVVWSYSDAPTGGRLTIADGGTTVFDVDITNGGPGALNLSEVMGLNTQVVITLASGAGAIVGKLQAHYTTKRN